MENIRLSVQEVRVRAHMSVNNGMCSPYVTVKLVPGPGGSVAISKLKTVAKSRTLFPMFDQTFDMILPDETTRNQILC